MVSKRDFGVSYLLGTGLGLIVTLTWFFLLVDAPDIDVLIPTATAGFLSGTFVFVGYWMVQSDISEETVWTVARWSAIGLAVPVVIGLVIFDAGAAFAVRSIFPGMLVNLIAVGGVIGLLLGLVLEMHREQSELRQLNRRNRVLNRVLRHNIRNDMSVMQFHVDLLDEAPAGEADASIEALRRKTQDVIETSDAARRIDELESDGASFGPMDVVELVETQVETARAAHEDATIDVSLPERAPAAVGPIFRTVLDNVIENAIEHHPGDPHVEVSVERRPSTVAISVTDDGPGISDAEIETLQNGPRTQLEHGPGLGLWLVRWIVDHFDGSVRIEQVQPRGTRVTIEVPAAQQDEEARRSRLPGTGTFGKEATALLTVLGLSGGIGSTVELASGHPDTEPVAGEGERTDR